MSHCIYPSAQFPLFYVTVELALRNALSLKLLQRRKALLKGKLKEMFYFLLLLLPSYTFYVVAMDQGSPPLNSSTLHVNITVVDENDNNPKFEQLTYSVEVWENETIGGHVVQVKATERDSGIGSHIGYSISAGDPLGQFKIFYNSVRSFFLFSYLAAVDKNLQRQVLRSRELIFGPQILRRLF